MDIDYQILRLDGIYQQNAAGQLMLRVKAPAGILSSAQAERICAVSEEYSNGILHLTSRGSVEFHWLDYADIEKILPLLHEVGLTSRGACGGAVRGITCSTTFGANFSRAERFAARLHRHFAGNSDFEGLPKKFKISVDGDYDGARHLIQDVGLVFVRAEGETEYYDLWCAGGLGRAPQAGFLYAHDLEDKRVIPLIESIIRVYAEHAEKGARLKTLLNNLSEKGFRQLVARDQTARPIAGLEPVALKLALANAEKILGATVFAGELEAGLFRELAQLADKYCSGFLVLTNDQDVALPLADHNDEEQARRELAEIGFSSATPEEQTSCRVCPGNHECRMGLAATRDVAKELIIALDAERRSASWAISGCPNSCSQPQLADFGIVTVKAKKAEDGTRTPLFDLYRRDENGLGDKIAEKLELNELLKVVNHPPTAKL